MSMASQDCPFSYQPIHQLQDHILRNSITQHRPIQQFKLQNSADLVSESDEGTSSYEPSSKKEVAGVNQTENYDEVDSSESVSEFSMSKKYGSEEEKEVKTRVRISHKDLSLENTRGDVVFKTILR